MLYTTNIEYVTCDCHVICHIALSFSMIYISVI